MNEMCFLVVEIWQFSFGKSWRNLCCRDETDEDRSVETFV